LLREKFGLRYDLPQLFLVERLRTCEVGKLREAIKADLQANVGARGLWKAISALLWHPGFATICMHRTSQALHRQGFRRLAKCVWRMNVMQSSCHFHPDCVIGPGLVLPHASGIVIGAGVVLGPNVTIYQGVTVGHGKEGYPHIERDVIIYPNAVVVGKIHVSAGTIIGAGSFVVSDLPRDAIVANEPSKIVRVRRRICRRSVDTTE
jgi:serine O-acetyltransferase